MRGFDRKRILLLIFLISLASAILGKGIAVIVEGDIAYDSAITNPELKHSKIKSDFPVFVAPPSNIVETWTIYTSTDVFSANNEITVGIYAIVNNSSKQDFMKAINLGSTDLSSISNSNVTQVVEKFEKTNLHYINLTRSEKGLNIVLQGKTVYVEKDRVFNGNWTWTPDAESELTFLILPYKNNLVVDDAVFTNDPPFVIYPYTVKLQSDANKNTLQQNIESAKINAHVEGLTLVIIGLVPLGLFMETIIHRFLTDYGKEGSDPNYFRDG